MGRRKRSAVDVETFETFEQDARSRLSPQTMHRHTDYSIALTRIAVRRSYYSTTSALPAPIPAPASAAVDEFPASEPDFPSMVDYGATEHDDNDDESDFVDPTLRSRMRKRTFAGVSPFLT